jgi:hypothetical protein
MKDEKIIKIRDSGIWALVIVMWLSTILICGAIRDVALICK